MEVSSLLLHQLTELAMLVKSSPLRKAYLLNEPAQPHVLSILMGMNAFSGTFLVCRYEHTGGEGWFLETDHLFGFYEHVVSSGLG